jgi:hypothetical protein
MALLAAISASRADTEEREISALVASYVQNLPPPSIAIAVVRVGDDKATCTDGCAPPEYKLVALGEEAPAGYPETPSGCGLVCMADCSVAVGRVA